MVKALVCLLLVAASATTIYGLSAPVNVASNVHSPNAAIRQNNVQNLNSGLTGLGYGGLVAAAPYAHGGVYPLGALGVLGGAAGYGGYRYGGYGGLGGVHDTNVPINIPSNVHSPGALISQNNVQNNNAGLLY